jgi:hypothetical protein
MLYAAGVKLFAEVLELFTCAVFQLIVCKTASSDHILQGALNQDCREDEGEQSTQLLMLPPL